MPLTWVGNIHVSNPAVDSYASNAIYSFGEAIGDNLQDGIIGVYKTIGEGNIAGDVLAGTKRPLRSLAESQLRKGKWKVKST